MDDMIKVISQYPNGTYVKLEWIHDFLVLGGTIETIYETDNGKIEGTSLYREFSAFAFRIKEVLRNDNNGAYPIGSLVEISPDTAPNFIYTQDDAVIWKL